MRGMWTGEGDGQWCDRRLLARIHRYTLGRLRREIQPVTLADFMRFAFGWHGIGQMGQPEGPDALAEVLRKLEGFEAPAAAWEADLLPARTHEYDPAWLDTLCLSGRTCWLRLTPVRVEPRRKRSAGPLKTAPMALLPRQTVRAWLDTARGGEHEPPTLSSDAARLDETLAALGPCFLDEMVESSGCCRPRPGSAVRIDCVGTRSRRRFCRFASLDRRQNEEASTTRARGFGCGRIRALVARCRARRRRQKRKRTADVAWVLLRRYGVVFRSLMDREMKRPAPVA